MGELILCYGKIAALPYYMENASLNIYSLEELCYYLEQYQDRLEESFFGQELFLWIENELLLKDLAKELEECQKNGGKMAELAGIILRSGGYLTEREILAVLEQLKELDGKDDFERGKIRADRCLKSHRYAESILEYRRLIQISEKEGALAVDVGNIWHNMGVACANMFLYEQAVECFEKAYQYNNQPESLIEMYFAMQCISGKENPDAYEPPKEWRGQVMERLQQAVDELEETDFTLPEEAPLDLWKKKYRLYSKL